MAATPEDEDQGGSYLGLVSVLIVIVGFLALLVWAGIGPLRKPEEASNVPVAVTSNAPTPPPATGGPMPGNLPQTAPAPANEIADATVLTRIAVGSGIDQRKPIPILSAVLARKPQLFILAGDAVAADVPQPGADVSGGLLIASAYGTLDTNADYRAFKSALPIVGTWGDRDYGLSGAGASFPYKAAAKEAFVQFYGLGDDSDIVRHDGVYSAHVYGPEGQRTQIILLDTRSFRSDVNSPDKTMLGAEQWAWLEQQLIVPADIRLIVSSIPVESDAVAGERWGDLPLERERLFDTIRATGAQGVVFISGDQGTGAIYKADKGLGAPLFELASSGLNTPAASAGAETDPARTDKIFAAENFGVVEIDWTARALNLELRDQSGNLLQGQSVPFPPKED